MIGGHIAQKHDISHENCVQMEDAKAPVGVQMAALDAAVATGFGFWRLPLDNCDDLEDPESSRPDSPVDYWRLPLLSLDLDEIDPQEKTQETIGRDEKHVLYEPEVTAAATGTTEDYGELEGSVEADKSPSSKPQNKAQEINDMLNRCRVERGEFDKNLRELEEVQTRLKALISRAQKQVVHEPSVTASSKRPEGASSGEAATSAGERGALPSEVLSFVLWCLDFASLARAGTVCLEWSYFSRSEDRWIRLLATDWGVYAAPPSVPLLPFAPSGRSKSSPSSPQSRALPVAVQDYRHCLNRFRQMNSTLASLKSTGISGVCGSLARKRVFDALELLVDLGSSRDQNSFYPSQVPELLHKLGAWRPLLALLDDESPHLQWLAVRCLADLVGSEAAQTEPPGSAGGLPVSASPGTSVRLLVREEIVRRGALIRELLEGDDIDLVESSARLMLNLHSSFPGTPLGASMRGPFGVLHAQGFCNSDFSSGSSSSSSSFIAAEIWAQAWSGVWVGEMCYARGGEKHADLRLILGLAGDPAVDRGKEALRVAAGLTAEFDEEPEEVSSSSGRRHVRSAPSAQYWHYFGFLANSDFDGPVDTVRYIDEQIRKRRQQPSSPSASNSEELGKDLKLVGVGWDEQNGLFTAEAQLPKMPVLGAGGRGRSGVLGTPFESSAVPLRLKLRYDQSWSSYELTAFLTDGRAGEAGKGVRVPTLFGVWATAPSMHKHLFVLRRTGTLESVV
eukprot:TRINITY_DN36607_c0_g1_i1.p1 TRINITY_DN36607_c0_g1~~TRINITY_DN36607_c0_g1_i1.p1  ORF type:complete len:735 (+),score=117.30 TRINITY_DN36607_c0_g1_i1:74-2278(+)